MTYICPNCYHQQKERTYCIECNFDLKSNHLNPYCSKCKIKFKYMDSLKIHFKNCDKEFLPSNKSDVSNSIMFDDEEAFNEKHERIVSSNVNLRDTKDVWSWLDNISPNTSNNENDNSADKLKVKKNCCLCGVERAEKIIEFCPSCGFKLLSCHGHKCSCPKCKRIFYGSTKHEDLKIHYKICNFENICNKKCINCCNIFKDIKYYNKHKRKCMPYPCPHCKLSFNEKFNRNKHINRKVCWKQKYAQCYFENCDVRCFRRAELMKHVRESHGVEMKYEIVKFQTLNDFELWKDQLGMETLTFYAILSKNKYRAKGEDISTICYGCSFDFQPSFISTNQEKRAGVNKKRKSRIDYATSNVCPSRIQVKIFPSNEVIAKVCTTHSHDIKLENISVQRLPKYRREFLTEAFLMGADVDQVMDVIKTEAETLNIVTKESCLPRRFFKETQRKTLMKYDKKAILKFVQDMKEQNGLLIYKHDLDQHEDHHEHRLARFGYTSQLEKDSFVIGWQTPEMLKMLKTYGHILYVEGLFTLPNNLNHHLYNFLISDDNNKVFPVAHFITNKTDANHLLKIFSSLETRTRLNGVNVINLIIQNDKKLEEALRKMFNNTTLITISTCDLESILPIKRIRRTPTKIESSNDIEEQLTNQRFDYIDCFFQFHKDLKSKLKRIKSGHRIYTLLSILKEYFIKIYSDTFNIRYENNVTIRKLTEMRRKLLDFKFDTVVIDETDVEELFDADVVELEEHDDNELVKDNSDTESNNTDFDENEEDINEDEEQTGMQCDNSSGVNLKNSIIYHQTESIEEYDIQSSMSDVQCSIEDTQPIISDTYSNISESTQNDKPKTSDEEYILQEILATSEATEDDDTALNVLKQMQQSILDLLENNVSARTLILRTVLSETILLQKQVQKCCDQTSKVFQH